MTLFYKIIVKKSKNSDVFQRNWTKKFKAYFTFYIAFKMIKQALMKTLKYNRDV